MFYKRDILSQLENELKTKETTVITGMRQVGKTTLLIHLFDLVQSANKVLLDLENPLHRKIFEEENFDAVWSNLSQFGITNSKKAFIFLDEVQNLPQISRVVKYLYDHWPVKFFLTGSSSYYLKNLFPESLAGRKIIFEIYPLTFKEFMRFKGIELEIPDSFSKKAEKKNKIAFERYSHYYQKFLEFGGFPAVVLEKNQQRKRMLLQEIFTSYFEKDAKNLADFRDMSKLRDLILLLVTRIGSRLEIGKLASDLSITRETVYNYLSFLEHTYFISLLPKFSASYDRQAAGSKKLYFCDTGIANILGKLSLGQLFEQSVFQSLRPWYRLHYFSKRQRGEIDFVVNDKIALEIKVSTSRQDIEHLRRRAIGARLKEYYIVTLGYNDQKKAIVAVDF